MILILTLKISVLILTISQLMIRTGHRRHFLRQSDTANLIWSSTKESNYKSLFLKQKTAIRIVSSASYNAHTEPLFKQAKILPLPKLCLFFKLQFFFQFTQGFLPAALRNMWIRNRDRNPDHLYRLRNENEIFTFTSRLSHFENFPLYSIPSL